MASFCLCQVFYPFFPSSFAQKVDRNAEADSKIARISAYLESVFAALVGNQDFMFHCLKGTS